MSGTALITQNTGMVRNSTTSRLKLTISSNGLSELHTKSVKIEIRPGEIGGWMGWKETFIKDPNGIWIEFLQRKK